MLFAAIWMDLEIIVLSEVSQRKTMLLNQVAKSQTWLTDWTELNWTDDITYMWNLEKNMIKKSYLQNEHSQNYGY